MPTTIGQLVPVPSAIASLFSGPVGYPLSSTAQVEALVANSAGVVLEWKVIDGTSSSLITRNLSNPLFPTLSVSLGSSGPPAYYMQMQMSGSLNLFDEITFTGEFDITAGTGDRQRGVPVHPGRVFGDVQASFRSSARSTPCST